MVITSKVNQGIARSLNLAIARARAPYLAVMDSDDVALPDRLETELKFFQAHQDFVLVGSHVELIDFRGGKIARRLTSPQTIETSMMRCSGAAGRSFTRPS